MVPAAISLSRHARDRICAARSPRRGQGCGRTHLSSSRPTMNVEYFGVSVPAFQARGRISRTISTRYVRPALPEWPYGFEGRSRGPARRERDQGSGPRSDLDRAHRGGSGSSSRRSAPTARSSIATRSMFTRRHRLGPGRQPVPGVSGIPHRSAACAVRVPQPDFSLDEQIEYIYLYVYAVKSTFGRPSDSAVERLTAGCRYWVSLASTSGHLASAFAIISSEFFFPSPRAPVWSSSGRACPRRCSRPRGRCST